MAGINTGKVIVGGLAAGVVGNVIDFATNSTIMMSEYRSVMAAHNIQEAVWNGRHAMIGSIVTDFLFGILIVFAYAAIRPRFGPGPKTAIIAGLIPYIGACLVVFSFTEMGMFTQEMLVKGCACALVSTIGASLVGGMMYSE